MKLALLVIFTIIVSVSYAQTPKLIFKSAYEGSSHVVQNWQQGNPHNSTADIEGVDNGWDWESTINNDPNVGFFVIRYEVLDTLAAKAEIVSEPENISNKVLKFVMNAPNVGDYGNGIGKGRIQGVFTKNDTLRSFFIKQKLLIHKDFDFFTESQFDSHNLNWMTIQEFWNNTPKDGEELFPFRVTLNIRKPKNSDTLYFGVHAQTQDRIHIWDNVWDTIATWYPIPLGSWLDIETYFVEGDSQNGKFKFIVTDQTGIKHTIFDITGFTHHPLDPNPDGVTTFNPMKLYTFGPYIDTMAANDKCLCLYWDDFELWKFFETISTVQEENKLSTLVYPVPATNFVTITFDNNKKNIFTLKIYNLMGKNVGNISNISSDELIIQRGNLPDGVYFFQLYSNTSVHAMGKIIFD